MNRLNWSKEGQEGGLKSYTVLRQKVEPLGKQGGVTFQGPEKETEGPIYKLGFFVVTSSETYGG